MATAIASAIHSRISERTLRCSGVAIRKTTPQAMKKLMAYLALSPRPIAKPKSNAGQKDRVRRHLAAAYSASAQQNKSGTSVETMPAESDTAGQCGKDQGRPESDLRVIESACGCKDRQRGCRVQEWGRQPDAKTRSGRRASVDSLIIQAISGGLGIIAKCRVFAP